MVVPDRELVERARRGDGAAIGELFSRDWRAARAAGFGITGAAMPQANEWTLDVGVAARQLLTFPATDRNCPRDPACGFAEGRPGAFLRGSRGLLLTGNDGTVRTTYRLLQDSPDSDRSATGSRPPESAMSWILVAGC
jgi:hypothetical protein